MSDDVGFRVQILLCKGGLDKDLSSTIATIVRFFLLTCMLGLLEKDENSRYPEQDCQAMFCYKQETRT